MKIYLSPKLNKIKWDGIMEGFTNLINFGHFMIIFGHFVVIFGHFVKKHDQKLSFLSF